jgi:hypothetical protein
MVVRTSSFFTEQLKVLQDCACPHVLSWLPTIGHCALQHVLNDGTHAAVTKPATGWKCQKLFKCSYCATDFRIHVTMANPSAFSLRVDTWQDFGKSATTQRSAQAELFDACYPGRLHEDEARSRNLEKLYDGDFQLTATHGGDSDDSLEHCLVHQTHLWYGSREKEYFNRLLDF